MKLVSMAEAQPKLSKCAGHGIPVKDFKIIVFKINTRNTCA
jgi:hypothetical protein